jgi:Cache domain
MGRRIPQMNQKVLAVFLLVSLPILAAGVVLVLLLGQSRVSDWYGGHLSLLAQQTASVADSYVYGKVLDVTVMGRTPDVREIAAAGSKQPNDPEKTRALDTQWQKSGQVPAGLAGILDNTAARYLADVVANDPIYRELMVTDRHGRVVAASNRVSDYDQSDEDWWKAAVEDQQRGRTSVTDVRWDESAKVRAIEISVPVPEPGSDRLAGVLKAVIDARELLAAVGGLQPGTTGQATLLRPNGTIVFSRTTNDPNARFFATRELSERLGALSASQGLGEERIHFSAEGADGQTHVIGIAPSQLSRTYPNITWLVAISQAADEFLAPGRTIGWYLAVLFAVTAILVLFLALWFSMRLSAPGVDVDMELVEHAPGSRTDTEHEEYEEPKKRSAG